MVGGSASRVVQITNIAPQATKDQMQTLFGNIGKIEEIRLYPTVRDVSCPVQSRICYVKYAEGSCVPVAQHLTNTVFIDRALIVIPVVGIPEEYRALEMSKNGSIVPGLQKPDSKLPPEVMNRIEGSSPQQVIKTYDPKLVENKLPEYPALPSFYDARKIEEIRRTIFVCDVKNEWRLDDLLECFQCAGEVKYARWAEKDSNTLCMIEFCEQPSIIQALKMQGHDFKGGFLNVYHATDSIAKPEAKSNEAAQAEIEEAMTIVKEAQNMISAAIDPVIGMLAKDKRRRSRSRSRSRGTSRSNRSRSHRRSHSRTRKRSHSKAKRRSRSRSHRRNRSRSKSKRCSRSHSRRNRSRSKSKHRSRSNSRRINQSRSKSKHRSRDRSRDRCSKRSRSRHRRSASRNNSRRSNSRERKRSHRKTVILPSSKISSVSKRCSRSNDRKLRAIVEDTEIKLSRSSVESKFRKSDSLEKSDNMDISNSP